MFQYNLVFTTSRSHAPSILTRWRCACNGHVVSIKNYCIPSGWNDNFHCRKPSREQPNQIYASIHVRFCSFLWRRSLTLLGQCLQLVFCPNYARLPNAVLGSFSGCSKPRKNKYLHDRLERSFQGLASRENGAHTVRVHPRQ